MTRHKRMMVLAALGCCGFFLLIAGTGAVWGIAWFTHVEQQQQRFAAKQEREARAREKAQRDWELRENVYLMRRLVLESRDVPLKLELIERLAAAKSDYNLLTFFAAMNDADFRVRAA